MNDHDENLRLEEENVRLKKELHGYEVRLASLCNKGYQGTDGEIKVEYQKIYEAIERWIRYALHSERADFGETFQDAINNEDKTRRLSALGLDPASPATSCGKLNWLKTQGGLNYFILSLVISRGIFPDIIEEEYPIGFHWQQGKLLYAVERQFLDSEKGKLHSSEYS